MRYTLLSILGVTLIGSLLWDRLCVALFAPRIFAAQMRELASLSLSDFWGARQACIERATPGATWPALMRRSEPRLPGPNSPKYLGGTVVVGLWFYLFDGNIVVAGLAYYGYKKLIKETFNIIDVEQKGIIDRKEVSYIMRYLL